MLAQRQHMLIYFKTLYVCHKATYFVLSVSWCPVGVNAILVFVTCSVHEGVIHELVKSRFFCGCFLFGNRKPRSLLLKKKV